MSSNRHDRAPDHSTVSIQNGGQTLPCGFSLDRNDFQSFDALASAFNLAEAPLRFHKKGTRYFKASDLASFGKNEDKTTLSKPAKTSKVLDKTWTNFSMVGQLCR